MIRTGGAAVRMQGGKSYVSYLLITLVAFLCQGPKDNRVAEDTNDAALRQ
jgi:hypothetical protein